MVPKVILEPREAVIEEFGIKIYQNYLDLFFENGTICKEIMDFYLKYLLNSQNNT